MARQALLTYRQCNLPGPASSAVWPGWQCSAIHLAGIPALSRERPRFDFRGVCCSGRNTALRITLSHDRPPQELKHAVDRSLDDLLRGIVVLPVQLLDLRKTWEGNRLAFSFVA